MTNRSNTAYDLSRFEPKKAETPAHRSEEQKIRLVEPKKRTVRQARAEAAQTAYKTIKIFSFTCLFVFVIAFQIYSTVRLDELNHEIAVIEKNMSVAESENTRLNMQLGSILGITKIEDYAVNKLGMVKQESYMIEYVNLSDGDKVVLSQAKQDNGDGVWGRLKKLWSYIF